MKKKMIITTYMKTKKAVGGRLGASESFDVFLFTLSFFTDSLALRFFNILHRTQKKIVTSQSDSKLNRGR